MEKILINKRGEAISFNTESNSITPMIDNITCNLYQADKDGQVVTNNEVIDVKKENLYYIADYGRKINL